MGKEEIRSDKEKYCHDEGKALSGDGIELSR